MDATTRFNTEHVGALSFIVAFLEKMRLADLVDEYIPWQGEIPLGTLVEIMICNRLLNPKAQYKIGQWAEKAGVCQYYGISAEELNDDRLGRALERIGKHAFAVQPQLLVHLVKTFKLNVSDIHYDISNVELYGNYERQLNENGDADEGPAPKYGHTKSGRKNVKQVQFGINVARDGAVPIDLIPLDGNQAEVKTHVQNLARLKQMLPKQKLVYVADTKFDSPQNLLTNKAYGGKFLCGGAFQPHFKEEYLTLLDKLKPVNYCRKSKRHLPVDQQPKYKACEVNKTIRGVVDGQTVRLKHRVIYVWSQAKQTEEAKTRERHTQKVRTEFEKVQRNLNKHSLKTEDKIVQRLEKARSKYAIGQVFTYQLSQRAGKFKLDWEIDQQKLDRQIKLEGAYMLKTDLTKKEYPIAKVLGEYSEQIHVERRIGDIKGPLAIAPMWLEKPLRIAGLMQILLWALMAMSLMERSVRQDLNGEPMYGIYPENRPCKAPTLRGILECFEEVCVVVVKHKGTTTRRLVELDPVQRELLRRMAIPPTALRAFKRRSCGVPPPCST